MSTPSKPRKTAAQKKALLTASVLLRLKEPLIDFIQEETALSDDLPEYLFVGKTGAARTTAKSLNEYRYCAAAIRVATGEVPGGSISAERWRETLGHLWTAKTVQTLGPQAGVTGTTRAWLLGMLRLKGVAPEGVKVDDTLFDGTPIEIGGKVWFSIDLMLDELEMKKVRVTRRDVMRGLYALGVHDEDKRVEHYTEPWGVKRRNTRTLWPVPDEVVAEYQGTTG